jgi:hypothetical protein
LTLQVALPMSIFIENPTVASLARPSTVAMDGGESGSQGDAADLDGISDGRNQDESVTGQDAFSSGTQT